MALQSIHKSLRGDKNLISGIYFFHTRKNDHRLTIYSESMSKFESYNQYNPT